MVKSCDRCNESPVVFFRYSGQHLCSEHFLDLLLRRVKKEIRYQQTIRKRDRIGVALSGGKDSMVALKLMNRILASTKGKQLVGITVDEGIEGYRPSSVDISRKICTELDIEFQLTSFRDLFGTDLDDIIARSDLGPCTICGILRRKALNKAASDADVDVLVTGHNLDDMAQTVLMNVMGADVQRLARLGPHLEPIPGFIPRSMPLRTTPETETYLAAVLMDLPIHELECPYSVTAKRGHFRDLLLKAEGETPGTRHSLLRFHEQISPLIPREGAATEPCVKCGEPVVNSVQDPVCKACELLRSLGVGK